VHINNSQTGQYGIERMIYYYYKRVDFFNYTCHWNKNENGFRTVTGGLRSLMLDLAEDWYTDGNKKN
jgi:hypothetical protein